MNLWIDFLNIAGSFCLLYFIFIMLYVGPRFSFHYVWAVAGIVLHSLAGIIGKKAWVFIPAAVLYAGGGLLIVGLILLLAMEIRVFSKMRVYPRRPVQYMIVLGACVRGTRVTRSLAYRLKKAASYAKTHPQCMLVVSGGQGPGEDITEAQAMYLYLQKLGIPRDRILLEDQSVNTQENLIFSRNVILSYEAQKKEAEEQADTVSETMQEKNLVIAVCSNNFHMYRAIALANAAGQWKVEGLAAMTDPFMWLSFTVREGAALFKELLFRHISW